MVKNKEEDLWKTTHKEEDNGLKQQASKQASKQAAVHGMYWWHSRCLHRPTTTSKLHRKKRIKLLPAKNADSQHYATPTTSKISEEYNISKGTPP
jgi:phage gp46-like protein